MLIYSTQEVDAELHVNGKWYLHTNTYTLIQLDAHIRVQPMEGRAPERGSQRTHTIYI